MPHQNQVELIIFFKKSKKYLSKTTHYVSYSDYVPDGGSVVCLALQKETCKKILLKNGDTAIQDNFFDTPYHKEIKPHKEVFAISRELFCAELIRDIDPH